MAKGKIIFFGNGPLAEYALSTLKDNDYDIIFHAHDKADLEEVKRLKSSDKNNEIHGVLASFGVLIKPDVLDLFEPEGILNIHPSLLPQYRGPSPIESAILNGDHEFSVSIMKLVTAMDAGPIYYQTTCKDMDIVWSSAYYRDGVLLKVASDALPSKDDVYFALAYTGATWLAEHLDNLPTPTPQSDHAATYTRKFTKADSSLDPTHQTATELQNQIRAFANFPKSKYTFYGLDCIIIEAHVATPEEIAKYNADVNTLSIQCYDNSILAIDQIQPAGRKIMDAKSFLNGYAK